VGRTAFVLGQLPRLLAGRPEPLFHAAGNFNLPLARVPGKRFVLTIHDLIPELLPHTVSLAYRTQFRWWLARSLRVADAVICVSHATREDLLKLHPEVGAKATVVHHGVDHVERVESAEVEEWYRGLGLPPFHVLYAGSLDARKNVALVLEAVHRLRRSGRMVPLVLVGQRWFGSEPTERRIEALRQGGLDIRLLGHQPTAHLHRLMQGAGAFVFPSRAEGFGLPPLEAMSLGAPVVISATPALQEVCDDAAVVVSPDDADGLARALVRLMDSPEERRWRAEAGVRRARRFTWKAVARTTCDLYAHLLEKPRD
jgi:glycosyltransferase involved in cell wall biosynthesis